MQAFFFCLKLDIFLIIFPFIISKKDEIFYIESENEIKKLKIFMKRIKNLVSYSDSEDSDSEEKKVEKKIKISDEANFDYPINLEGSFPSFIYIEIEIEKTLETLQNKIIKVLKEKHEFQLVKCLHISLSQNFSLNLHQIDGFLDKIQSKMFAFFN